MNCIGISLITFVTFLLTKESLEAIELISKAVGCHPSQFAVAGIKDRRAITTQIVSVRDVPAEKYGDYVCTLKLFK